MTSIVEIPPLGIVADGIFRKDFKIVFARLGQGAAE
jgi:hypothetical protein